MSQESMPWRARLCDPRDIPPENMFSDGDTLWLTTDQGDWERKVRSIRLRGVRCPEKTQPGWAECRAELARWIVDREVGKWPYRVDTYLTGTLRDDETLGRIVGMVWDANRIQCLNDHMIRFVAANRYPLGN